MRWLVLTVCWLAAFVIPPAGHAAQPLRLLIYSEYLDPEVAKEFEQAHDAKLTLDLFEEGTEVVAKLQGGGAGQYDVVVVPNHLVPVLIKLNLLSPLRPERLPNLKHLDPRFRSPSFDPRNEYTVAYHWGTVGIYYRRLPGQPAPDSWAMFFDAARPAPGPLVLLDSMRDTIGSALKFRGRSLNSTNTADLREARDLLLVAKKRSVAMEGSVGARNRVLGRTAVAAMVYSGEAASGMADDPETAYVIPREGSQVWVDSLTIPARAPRRDLAETFINHLLDPQVAARNATTIRFATANLAARPFLPAADLANPVIYAPSNTLDRLEFLHDVGGRTRLYDEVWTQVKSR